MNAPAELHERTALEEAAARVAALLRSVRTPDAPALGRWTVADVAAHLSHAFQLIGGLARQEAPSPLEDLWDLSRLTTGLVDDDPERDPYVLADRIDARAADFLAVAASTPADDRRPWLVRGTVVTMSTLTCHLLTECLVHGHDIARADGQRWHIRSDEAGLVLHGFVTAVFATLHPHTFVDQEKAAGLRACYDLRFRKAGRFFAVFEDGSFRIEPTSSRSVDCHIWADPAAFLLVAWGRRSQWQAILSGEMLAWGRRPWLGAKLRELLRTP